MEEYLFQFNVAKMRVPFDDPLFDDFKVWIRSLHALAEASDGFVWRYEGEKTDAGYIQVYDGAPLIMGNMSAWRDYDSLYEYTFTDGHLEMMKQKRKWFEKIDEAYSVLYYGGDEFFANPLEKAKDKLRYLRVYGETPAAFGFGPHKGKV